MNNYNLESSNNKKSKLLRIKLLCYLLIMLSIYNLFGKNNKKNSYSNNVLLAMVTTCDTDDIHRLIYASPYLTKDEKDYLYNEDFLTDYLLCVDDTFSSRARIYSHFTNNRIESYNDDNAVVKDAIGYYMSSTPETIYIKNYDKFDDKYKDTIAHEFIHLCQNLLYYNLISEASAEIISEEYYEGTYSRHYLDQVKLLKKLMEIIGAKPIWYYIFTGDFSLIEARVKPYLSESEYQEFLNDLAFDLNDMEINEIRCQSLNQLLAKLYKNIYGKDIEDDLIISLIDENNTTLVRYYFNHRYINEENSYYIDEASGTYKTLNYKDAMENGLIYISATSTYAITMEEAFELIENGTKKVHREIDYHNNNIILYGRTDSYDKSYISAKINGVDYDNADVDELAKKGIIKVNYYVVNYKILTYEEYMNKEYFEDAYISVNHKPGTLVSEDKVYGLIPKKVFLPTITEKFEDSNSKTKKYEK